MYLFIGALGGGACKEIRGQLVRIISLLPPHGSQDQSHDC